MVPLHLLLRGASRHRVPWVQHVHGLTRQGSVDFEEFERGMRSVVSSLTYSELKTLFRSVDSNADNKLTVSEVRDKLSEVRQAIAAANATVAPHPEKRCL